MHRDGFGGMRDTYNILALKYGNEEEFFDKALDFVAIADGIVRSWSNAKSKRESKNKKPPK